MTNETQQLVDGSDVWLKPGSTANTADVHWFESGRERQQTCQSREQALELVRKHWQPGGERSLPYLTQMVNEFLPATAPAEQLKQIQPALGEVEGDVWVTGSMCAGSVDVNWRSGGSRYNTSANFRGQALQIALGRRSNQCRRSAAEIEAEINALLPPQEHADGDVWVKRSMCSGSVDVHWQIDWQSWNTSANFRGQALQIARSRWTPKCPRTMEQIEAEINELLPPQAHPDGDVWVTRSSCSGSVDVHWQVGWQSWNTSANFRGEALQIARSHWTPKCPRTMQQIEADINELLPPQAHPDGDVWVTRSSCSGSVDIHWQVGWQPWNTSANFRGEALQIARSHWTPKCPRTMEQIEAEINELLPPERHRNGNRWIEECFGSWRICWQSSGGSECHQLVSGQQAAERWLYSRP